MRRPVGPAVALFVGAVASCASASGTSAPSPYLATCPAAATTPGYPVVASADPAANVHPVWLESVATAAAYRWAVPSRGRGSHAQWRSVRSRVLPPEPRWADDWSPDARHRADLAITMHRDERIGAPVVRRPSGDRLFDESLATIFDDPLPASPAFPALPPGTGDSVQVVLTFGDEPTTPTAGLVRFAAHQTPVEVIGGLTIRLPFVSGDPRRAPPPPPRVVTKYDVDAAGRYLPETFEVLVGANEPLATAVADGLMRAQFRAARSNCRPISLTVLQVFGR